MIEKACFNSSWIKNKHKEISADPILIEKAIYAFELLGSLVENGVNLTFKGGTGLMLLVPELKRLSIDIDIITEGEDETLDKAFNKIVREGVFKKWEEDERLSSHEIPKRHFKFYYASSIEKRDSYVLLDIVQVNSPFCKTIKKPITLPLFEVERELEVMIPTVDSFTGDKLSAFAPTSIGIPYGKGKSMEIIKQLFDLGILFEYITNFKEISKAYKKIAQLEASYRNISLPIAEFLNDSIKTSFLICQLDFRRSIENDYIRELRDGIRRIKSHILGGRYSLLNAKEDASKVACLASSIKDNRLDIDIERLKIERKDISRIKDAYLPEEFGILNRLKAISPESFYLWAVATKVKSL
ncbi:hypothetical protein CH333_01790 [candidate division WOR-3 bacterium JGI_Cruoil_03_44_89]|uniref:Nucleotidyl transferase AbiEii/AbiGii toxin family protein n=1 Tax=candidate division WOR-3 bacterium JGI_Cruoil_03_44_89 TaxID=1973748 RepID=A0A235BY48_UNCW3|nr:MAG: hypothetical protein CH333_01790 [candidate division WOR-3 bacterium JGI_Cruoil_03_44_89]